MSYDGNGKYNPPTPQYPAIPGTTIYAEDFNTIISDVAAALSSALVRDGQSAMVGDLNLGTHLLKNGAIDSAVTATTQAGGDNSTKLATTAFVAAAIAVLAPLLSPAFTGTPTAPTAADSTSSTQLATTAYAMTMYSPAFRGVPTAPTAAVGTNTTQLATTAFVQQASLNVSLPLQPGGTSLYKLQSVLGSASWAPDLPPAGSALYLANNFGAF